ncbi:MAG: UDP-N-acetylmuramate dehydrogenase [Clostridia bacterium]|nr:UDP-N-acetylmuramate dehydrogenase [Clostridia bacterium]
MDLLVSYLQHLCGTANVKCDEPLKNWTTFRVGGPARYFVLVDKKETLVRLIKALEYLEYPYFILGLGANVLASDQGYDGVVIKLNFHQIEHNDVFLYADAGAKLGAVVNYARDHDLSGIEWATGIPATVGGGIYMNCGAFGHSISEITVMVDVLDHGKIKTFTQNQLKFAYRHSVFMEQPAVIIGAYLRLIPGNKTQITNDMQTIMEKRRHHPHEPSAGSVFKRPKDNFAVGKVVEELGLKGYMVGGAQISPQHANFIVNTGNATCDDILKVLYHVQDTVEKHTGIHLEPEIIFLGKFN